MKRLILYILLVCFSISISQAQWVQTGGPKGVYVTKISPISGTNQYLYADGKSIFMSNNELDDWHEIFSSQEMGISTPGSIEDYCVFKNKLYVVHYSGGLYISDENFENFQRATDSIFEKYIYYSKENNGSLYIASHIEGDTSGFKIFRLRDSDWECITEWKSGFKYDNKYIDFIDNSIYATFADINQGGSGWTGPGVQVTDDDGVTWRTIKKGLTNTDMEYIGHNDSVIVMSSREGGMFLSYDRGENWEASEGVGLPKNFYVSGVVSNQDYLFILIDNYGCFRSSDNGMTWEAANKDIIYPQTLSNIYIYENVLYMTSRSGVYKSSDNANSWEYHGLKNAGVLDLIEHNGDLYTCSYAAAINKSSDEGNTWNLYSSSLPSPNISKMLISNDTVFVGLYDYAIYMSADNGTSWKCISTNVIKRAITGILKNDKYFFFCGLDGLFRTSDIGENWEELLLYDSLSLKKSRGMIENNGELFLADNGYGILKSTDDGTNWLMKNEGLTDFNIAQIAMVGDRIVAGTFNGNLFLSDDRGENWKLIYTNNNTENVIDIQLLDSKIIFSTYYYNSPVSSFSSVLMSNDDGQNWYDIKSGLDPDVAYISKFLLFDDYLYAGTGNLGVWKIKISDLDLFVDVVDEKLTGNYLYAYPPYPLPAKESVNTLIYWDSKLNINNADMGVYNFLGAKVCGKEHITLSQNSSWSGIVTWDATGTPPGIYFLQIRHGTRTEAIKMLIE